MYRYLTWRGRTAESPQCWTCLRSDGGHEDECGESPPRDFTPTEVAKLTWLNDRLDAIIAERLTSGVEDLHWQEHWSVCLGIKTLVSAAQDNTASM